MKTYNLTYVKNTPEWDTIPSLDINTELQENSHGVSASAQICYTDDALLVHLSTLECNIQAEEQGPLGEPCRDSCLEFFFCPCEGDGRYFNIEFNSNGCMYLGIASCGDDIVRLMPSKEQEAIFEPLISKKEDGWEIFYRVPYEFIRRFFPGFDVRSGKQMRTNCYKCAGKAKPPHYLSWSWLEGASLNFHNTKCFGTMIFE